MDNANSVPPKPINDEADIDDSKDNSADSESDEYSSARDLELEDGDVSGTEEEVENSLDPDKTVQAVMS